VKSFLPVHKSDAALSHDTPESLFRQDTQTAEALAHIAEFDARKLYRPAGYDSMHEYLVRYVTVRKTRRTTWSGGSVCA
jgi:hypothetical protein